MFTGIIERRAHVAGIQGGPGGRRLSLEVELGDGLPSWKPADVGESLSVSGVCLTVVASRETRMSFDVVPETLQKTTLGGLRQGDMVNIERSLSVGDRFGGHYVTGHTDGTGTIAEKRAEGKQVLVRIRAGKEILGEVLAKGSVAVDGVSLTVVEVSRTGGWFSFAAIPHTLHVTTLGQRRTGDRVNLETDAFGKYVMQGLREIFSEKSRDDWMAFLREAGWDV